MSSTRDAPTLISLAVHELRTPGNVVWGYLRMLQSPQDPPLSDHHRRLIDLAEKSCARFLALVDELSEVGKIDGGRIVMNRGVVDLFALAAEAAAGVGDVEDRGVRVDFQGPGQGASTIGDAQRLKQAFAAVFLSALREQSQPSGVPVRCSLAERDGAREAVISIGDEAQIAALANTPDAEFDDRRGGMGLALALADRVIAAHQGRVAASRGAAIIALPLNTTGSAGL